MSEVPIPFNRSALIGRELEYIFTAMSIGQISGDQAFTRRCHALLETMLGVPKVLVTTSRDRAIKSVEIATKNFIDDINYQVYNGGYYAVARNPMTNEVAVGGDEGLVRYYSIDKVRPRTMGIAMSEKNAGETSLTSMMRPV